MIYHRLTQKTQNIVIVVLLLVGCSTSTVESVLAPSFPAPTLMPEQISISTPVPTSAQIKEEIVSFLLNFVIQSEFDGAEEYIRSNGQFWTEVPPGADIIVWAPPNYEDHLIPLNTDIPIQVWWYIQGQLIEAKDELRPISEYRQHYIENLSQYSFTGRAGRLAHRCEFSILSVAKDEQRAEVYLGISLGIRAGTGYRYTLERDFSGQWQIVEAMPLWIS